MVKLQDIIMPKLIFIALVLLVQGCATWGVNDTPSERSAYGFAKGMKCGNDWLSKEREVARFVEWRETGYIKCKPKGSISSLSEAENLEIDLYLVD